MVAFLASAAPIKPKGLPPGFHTLPCCLHICNLHRQSPRLPASVSQPPSSSHPPATIFQWIYGAALTSPSSAWRASSITVFSARGPLLRSGYCPVRRTCHRRLTATWCRSCTSMSSGSLSPPTNFFEGYCITIRLSCSTSIPMGSSTSWLSSRYARTYLPR